MPATPTCEKEAIAKRSCCSDEVLLIQNHDKNPLTDIQSLSQQQLAAVLAAAVVLELLPKEIISEKDTFLPYKYDSHAPPLYELYCSFTFYG